MDKISPIYLQLGKIFEALENARLTPDKDFGAYPLNPYEWYFSPAAVNFLNRRNQPEWLFLKYNPQINFKLEAWQGTADRGAVIQLKLAVVPEAQAL